jgi:uncharacterized protein
MLARSIPSLVALGWALPALAASFNCSNASTPQEKAICADPSLSKLDDEMGAAYKAQRAQVSPAGAAEVQQDQRDWLVWLRQVCPEPKEQRPPVADCLKTKYAERLEMLQNGLQRSGGMTFFPRLKVMVVPDQGPPLPNTSDPGFGVGTFSWPEIDRPTPRQAAWNAAVRQEAVAVAAAGRESGSTPPADFEPATVISADTLVVYSLKAANERLISVTLENASYGYGAAHPNEFVIAFHWWLQPGRALKADDVFAPGSGWEAFLTQRCDQILNTGEHKDNLYDEQTVRRAIADSVTQVSNWIVDAQKFEIDFPEYSVAPRFAGSLSVELTWDELKPYLATAFDPAGLPSLVAHLPPQ